MPRSSRGLGRWPLTPVTRVRIPYAVPRTAPARARAVRVFRSRRCRGRLAGSRIDLRRGHRHGHRVARALRLSHRRHARAPRQARRQVAGRRAHGAPQQARRVSGVTGIDHVQVAAPPGCESRLVRSTAASRSARDREARRPRRPGRLLVRDAATCSCTWASAIRSSPATRRTRLCGCATRRRSWPSSHGSTPPGLRTRGATSHLPGIGPRFVDDPFGNRIELVPRRSRPPARSGAVSSARCRISRRRRESPPARRSTWPTHKPDGKLGLRNEETARARTAKRAERMAELATKLMAEHRRSVLVVLQGMDASGKDGTVKHCIGGLNPMSVRIAGFKAPSSTELAHDFLWRVHQVLPERGEIGIFNRSHYEDVLVVRVEELVPKQVWKKRYAAINAFEAHLGERGHDRRQALPEHLASRSRQSASGSGSPIPRRTGSSRPTISRSARAGTTTWPPMRAMLERTSTAAAPWHVVPADHKWVRDAVVTEVLTQTLEGLDLEVARARARTARPRRRVARRRRWGRALARPPRVRRALGRRARQWRRLPESLLAEVTVPAVVPAARVLIAAGDDRTGRVARARAHVDVKFLPTAGSARRAGELREGLAVRVRRSRHRASQRRRPGRGTGAGVDLHGVRAGREAADLDPAGDVAALLEQLDAAVLVVRALEARLGGGLRRLGLDVAAGDDGRVPRRPACTSM